MRYAGGGRAYRLCVNNRHLVSWLAVVGVLAVGCGAGGGQAGGGAAAPPTAKASARPSQPPLFEAPPGAETLTLRDQDNGRSVSIAQGARLTVVLGSTSWAFQGSSNTAVVRQVGDPLVKPGGTCPAGGGCGTASQTYEAVGTGQAQITATRTSCGDAGACTPEQANYRVTITVKI